MPPTVFGAAIAVTYSYDSQASSVPLVVSLSQSLLIQELMLESIQATCSLV